MTPERPPVSSEGITTHESVTASLRGDLEKFGGQEALESAESSLRQIELSLLAALAEAAKRSKEAPLILEAELDLIRELSNKLFSNVGSDDPGRSRKLREAMGAFIMAL